MQGTAKAGTVMADLTARARAQPSSPWAPGVVERHGRQPRTDIGRSSWSPQQIGPSAPDRVSRR